MAIKEARWNEICKFLKIEDSARVIKLAEENPLECKQFLRSHREALLKDLDAMQANVQVNPTTRQIIWKEIQEARQYAGKLDLPSKLERGFVAASRAEEAVFYEAEIVKVQGAFAEALDDLIDEYLSLSFEAKKELALREAALAEKEQELELRKQLFKNSLTEFEKAFATLKTLSGEDDETRAIDKKVSEVKKTDENESFILKKARELVTKTEKPEPTTEKAPEKPIFVPRFERVGSEIAEEKTLEDEEESEPVDEENTPIGAT